MPHADWNMMLALGLLLASALLGGQLAQMIRLPRVTAYLFVGLLLGPQTLNAITARDLVYLDPVGKLAMALVLFNVGCHFTLVVLRRLMRRGLQLSGGELGLTLTLVTGGLLLLGQPWQLALLLGAIALATAPATTILVFKENHSEGPVTELATFLVVINNLMSVVVFEVLLLGIHFMGGALAQPFHIELWHLVRDLIGSIGLGLVAGLVVSYGCGLLAKPRWFVLLVAVATLLLGAAEALHVPYLLTFLAMGITVANLSDQEKEISAELDHFTGLLCVVFFVIHGAELNWRLLFEAGDQGLLLLAPAYLVLRSLGK
ncbi:MAG: cation:proton antiporter, partial [Gemmataceae bacterium]